MALVRDLQRVVRERQRVHEATRAEMSTFIGSDGRKYFQLDTFGRVDREFPDKVSQSVQLDENGARQVMEALLAAFPALHERQPTN